MHLKCAVQVHLCYLRRNAWNKIDTQYLYIIYSMWPMEGHNIVTASWILYLSTLMFAATTKPPNGMTCESILFVTQRCIQNCRYILNILKIVACNITITQYNI